MVRKRTIRCMKVWHHQINEARSWEDLIQISRDYIASLSPDEWSSVPRACRPSRIKGIDDLAFWQRRLADEYLGVASSAQGNEMLRDMLAFFTTAAERSAEMTGRAMSSGEDAVNDHPSRGRAANRQAGE